MSNAVPFWVTKLGQFWRLVRESNTQPLLGQAHVPPSITASETAITFIGHSSFLVQAAGRALLIDPVFATRLILLRRQRRPGVRIRDLPPIAAVLLTHAHMDHLNRPSLRAITSAMRQRKLPAPVAIVPNGVEDLVRDLSFARICTLKWWESVQLSDLPVSPSYSLSSKSRTREKKSREAQSARETAVAGSIKITATPARHWGARMFHDTHRGFGGYVLQIPGSSSIYHSGDTAYFNGFAEIGRRLHPHIALLPIGAYFPDSYRTVHTSPEEAVQAFLDLSASVMIPMHYNSFRLGREPMSEPLPRLLAAASRAGVRNRIHPLAEGESWLTISKDREG
jgi:L-ascorbate metabolism protein UlaG (beta-lactamase superfamily)